MTTSSPSRTDLAYASAAQAFQQGRLDEAERIIGPYLAGGLAEARMLALGGFIRIRLNQFKEASSLLAGAHRLEPDNAIFALALGDSLLGAGDAAGAEAAYRKSIAIDPRPSAPHVGLSQALSALDRHPEALAVLEARLAAGDRDHRMLSTLSTIQTAMSRFADAIETCEIAVRRYPDSGIARHNLAAAYGDANCFEESIAAAQAARLRGQNGPMTELVLAHALQGLGHLDEADAAYRRVLDQMPLYVEALKDHAQLIWMRTGDVAEASRALAAATAENPGAPGLAVALAKVRHFGGDLAGAREVLEAARAVRDTPDMNLELLASELAIEAGDAEQGLALAASGMALDPELPRGRYSWCDALMAAGRADEAVKVAEALYQLDRTDQNALVRLATALRLAGDPRARTFFDYETFVRPYRIDVPKGWSSVEAYLSDLAAALKAKHWYIEHPVDQSLRHGGQVTLNLGRAKEPAIAAFASAIDGPIRRHIEHLRASGTELGDRALDSYEIIGAWSVRLRPNGYHHDHIHHLGWLSSAFYVEVPEAPPENPLEGCIKFGEPGTVTRPHLPAEHVVKPEPGTLVLFPSYMWHGTIPLSRGEGRMTIAMDVQPRDLRRRG